MAREIDGPSGRQAAARQAGVLVLVALVASSACHERPVLSRGSSEAVRIGRDPIDKIHVYENHSSALIAWRRAGVRDRVVVHLDGHIDLDWLPDEAVAAIAAARPEELGDLELHPYTLDDQALSRFAIWNFIYPAARLGLIRQLVWVVPDGTLSTAEGPVELGRFLLRRMQSVSLEEASGFQLVDGCLSGTLLGLPTLICELAGLPRIDEPVLLDLDLDYFTTRSAITQAVTPRAWIGPREVVEQLAAREIETDLVTLSMSTIGGYLPPGSRWIGRTLARLLEDPGGATNADRLHRKAELAAASGETNEAMRLYKLMVDTDPEDAAAWFALCRLGPDAASQACRRAVALDPLLEHWQLFEGDRAWINGEYPQALEKLVAYLERVTAGPFVPYALRRRADCLWNLGRLAEAESGFRRVLELAPDHPDTHLDLGELLRQQQRLGEAIEHLETARSLLPERASYALSLGTTYLMAGWGEAALAQLQEAVARQPCRAESRANLAVTLLELGRLDEAETHIATGLAIQPRQPTLTQVVRELDRRGVSVRPVKSLLPHP